MKYLIFFNDDSLFCLYITMDVLPYSELVLRCVWEPGHLLIHCCLLWAFVDYNLMNQMTSEPWKIYKILWEEFSYLLLLDIVFKILYL